MRKILIMYNVMDGWDIVSSDVVTIFRILSRNNYCVCFTENCTDDSLTYVSREEAEIILSERDAVLIYYHSMFWALGEEMLANVNAKTIFRYFTSFCISDTKHKFQKKEQTKKFIELSKEKKCLWLVDSEYTATKLNKTLDKEYISVCAPFYNIENSLERLPDENTLKKLIFGNKLNVLFYGIIMPNYNCNMMLEIVQNYIVNYDRNIHLYLIVNESDKLYMKDLKKKIRKRNLSNNIKIINRKKVNLLSYYLGCDIFLSIDEHRDNYMPALIAQYFGLPIVIRDSDDISDIIGENQVILSDNILEYVAAIRLLSQNNEYRDYLRKYGMENYHSNFAYESLCEKISIYLQNNVNIVV